jgi:hypothetical protein
MLRDGSLLLRKLLVFGPTRRAQVRQQVASLWQLQSPKLPHHSRPLPHPPYLRLLPPALRLFHFLQN